jgi:hypothetical protein
MTASSLRSWFEREFCGESKNILETPRNGYGIAFIDDLHACASDPTETVVVGSTPEYLLRGIMEGTPLFTMKRKVNVRSTAYFGYHAGSLTGGFEREEGSNPILHRELLMDPRNQNVMFDNYILQRMSIISAASCNISDIIKSDSTKSTLSKFVVVGVPLLSIDDLHVALISGINAGLRHDLLETTIIDSLESEIVE